MLVPDNKGGISLIEIILLLIVSYLIGSIPFTLIIGKFFFNKDLRRHGSGNLGASNAFRILGKKAGIVILVLDLFKGTIPVLLGYWLAPEYFHVFLFGLAAAIGHVFSIFIKFQGGKAVATSGGAVLGFNPILFLVLLSAFLLTLKLTKYVSVASSVAAITFVIASLFLQDWLMIILSILVAILVITKHISNFKRIKAGTEHKIKFM